ncbi:MAG TPA: SigE family RNA polymerase sigma factor [Actinomycetales bacterium]|nr:SigE family RNA polymerase sigma factor [Actinomycetales bacterium]
MVAFEEYVLARGSSLHRTAFLLTHDHALAEDLVQTALARSWRAWSRIQGDPDAYVRRVMVNTFASWWRRRWNGERATGEVIDVAQSDHGDDVVRRDGLVRALAALPRRQRAVVVLRFFEDLTEAQTAAALGVTVGTVKSQTAKALASLRVSPQLSAPELAEELS